MLEALVAVGLLAVILAAFQAVLRDGPQRRSDDGVPLVELGRFADRLLAEPEQFGLASIPDADAVIAWPSELSEALDRADRDALGAGAPKVARAARESVSVQVLANEAADPPRRWLVFTSGTRMVMRCVWGDAMPAAVTGQPGGERRPRAVGGRGSDGARRSHRARRSHGGFTLLELLLALAITSIAFAAIAAWIPIVGQSTSNARRTADERRVLDGIIGLIERDIAVGDFLVSASAAQDENAKRVDVLADGTLRVRTRSTLAGKPGPVTHEYRFDRSRFALVLSLRKTAGVAQDRIIAQGIAGFRVKLLDRVKMLDVEITLAARASGTASREASVHHRKVDLR